MPRKVRVGPDIHPQESTEARDLLKSPGKVLLIKAQAAWN